MPVDYTLIRALLKEEEAELVSICFDPGIGARILVRRWAAVHDDQIQVATSYMDIYASAKNLTALGYVTDPATREGTWPGKWVYARGLHGRHRTGPEEQGFFQTLVESNETAGRAFSFEWRVSQEESGEVFRLVKFHQPVETDAPAYSAMVAGQRVSVSNEWDPERMSFRTTVERRVARKVTDSQTSSQNHLGVTTKANGKNLTAAERAAYDIIPATPPVEGTTLQAQRSQNDDKTWDADKTTDISTEAWFGPYAFAVNEGNIVTLLGFNVRKANLETTWTAFQADYWAGTAPNQYRTHDLRVSPNPNTDGTVNVAFHATPIVSSIHIGGTRREPFTAYSHDEAIDVTQSSGGKSRTGSGILMVRGSDVLAACLTFTSKPNYGIQFKPAADGSYFHVEAIHISIWGAWSDDD